LALIQAMKITQDRFECQLVCLRPCLVPKKSQNILHSTRHIESLDVCMEH
jgi:hypothetical protein